MMSDSSRMGRRTKNSDIALFPMLEFQGSRVDHSEGNTGWPRLQPLVRHSLQTFIVTLPRGRHRISCSEFRRCAGDRYAGGPGHYARNLTNTVPHFGNPLPSSHVQKSCTEPMPKKTSRLVMAPGHFAKTSDVESA